MAHGERVSGRPLGHGEELPGPAQGNFQVIPQACVEIKKLGIRPHILSQNQLVPSAHLKQHVAVFKHTIGHRTATPVLANGSELPKVPRTHEAHALEATHSQVSPKLHIHLGQLLHYQGVAVNSPCPYMFAHPVIRRHSLAADILNRGVRLRHDLHSPARLPHRRHGLHEPVGLAHTWGSYDQQPLPL